MRKGLCADAREMLGKQPILTLDYHENPTRKNVYPGIDTLRDKVLYEGNLIYPKTWS